MRDWVFIFDCDGVLREFSWRKVYLAYIAIAEHFCCRDLFVRNCPDVETFRMMYSHDWKKNLISMGIEGEKNFTISNNIFKENYFANIEMFSWVPEILSCLSENNTITVFTNSSEISVRESLNGVNGHLSMVLGYERVQNLKPSPEGIECIMDNFGVGSERVVMIGDSDVDIFAGKNAGVSTALVTWGATDSEREITSLGADMVVQSPEDLLTLFN